MKQLAAIIITHKEPRQYFRKLKTDLNKKIHLTDKQIIEINNANNNIGFPAAVNKGIKKAIAENYSLFLILNPDLRITKLSIKEIRNSLDSPRSIWRNHVDRIRNQLRFSRSFLSAVYYNVYIILFLKLK